MSHPLCDCSNYDGSSEIPAHLSYEQYSLVLKGFHLPKEFHKSAIYLIPSGAITK